MPKFIKVRKSNRDKDRGFIATDMICAAFENRDAGHTEIMTLDGFWYEVTDGIEELYSDVMGEKKEDKKDDDSLVNDIGDNKKESVETSQSPSVVNAVLHRRFVSPAADDTSLPKNHEEVRGQKRKRGYVPKRFFKKPVSTSLKSNESLPSGDGRGQDVPLTKAVVYTPPEPTGM